MAPNLLLYLCIVILLEYALKALCEGASGRRRHLSAAAGAAHRSAADRIYALYRVGALIVHAAVLWGLSSLPLGQSLLTAAVLTALACTEVLASLASGWLYLRTQRLFRPLHLVPHVAFLAALLYTVRSTPWPSDLPHILARLHANTLPIFDPAHVLRTAVVFLLAATPSNYAIRWLMNKAEDVSLPELAVGDLLLRLPLATPRAAASWPVPAAAAEDAKLQTLQAGRIIGTLERWMLLALMARGEMAAVGFVFAGKSIVRYKEFDRKDFAEYYLVGTLYSILIALGLTTLL